MVKIAEPKWLYVLQHTAHTAFLHPRLITSYELGIAFTSVVFSNSSPFLSVFYPAHPAR